MTRSKLAKPRKRRRQSRDSGPGWQLPAVLGGVVLVVVGFLVVLSRVAETAPVGIEGTVVSLEISSRPGQLDRFHLRELTIEAEDGERTTLEVPKEVFEVVEEGHLFSRGPTERSRSAIQPAARSRCGRGRRPSRRSGAVLRG